MSECKRCEKKIEDDEFIEYSRSKKYYHMDCWRAGMADGIWNKKNKYKKRPKE